MSALDRIETFERLDPGRMRDLIAGLPAQCRAAWAAGQEWRIPESFTKPRRVVVLGMGGSAIGADVVATLAARMSTVPVQIVRGYTLPPIDEQTLVIASSYSGETEETLEAFQAALRGPGMHMAITGGGKLARLGESLNYAVLTYAFEGQPRAAIGWGVFPLLAILSRLGALQVDEATVDAAFVELTQAAADWGIDCPTSENAAKQIAAGLHGPHPGHPRPGLLRGGRAPLGRPDQREREAVGVLRRPARGGPQPHRGLRGAARSRPRRCTSSSSTARWCTSAAGCACGSQAMRSTPRA